MQSDNDAPSSKNTGLPQRSQKAAFSSTATTFADTRNFSDNAFDDEDFDERPFVQVTSRGNHSGRGRSMHGPKASIPKNLQAPSNGPLAASATSRPNRRDPLANIPLHIQVLQASGHLDSDNTAPLPINPSPILQTLQNMNVFPQEFPKETMIVTIKLPQKEASAPKRIIIMDITPSFFNTIVEALKTSAPDSIISESWSLALIVGIGPSPPPENEEDVTQYMFQILFRWSPSSSITHSQVQHIITTASASAHLEIPIITRSRRSDQPHSVFADTPLNCTCIFSRNITEAIPHSIKTRSPSLSYQFTLALHDNCPDSRILEVLSTISGMILNRCVSPSEKTFLQISPTWSTFTAAPRISNNWRHVAVFHRQPTDDCPRLLNSLLSLHKLHRSKLLLPTTDPASKVKNATFSFFNEMKQSKTKTNSNLIDWMVSAFNTFTDSNPISLQTETESESSATVQRDPRNPWKTTKKLANLIIPTMAPPMENYNEFLHQLQLQKFLHLKQPGKHYPPSSTSVVAPIHSAPLSISVTSTHANITYTVNGPALFTRYDFGQIITSNSKQFGQCCLFLCLAAAIKLNPADLAAYFTTRASMLCEVNTLYNKHQELQDDWTNFCHPSHPPNFTHLVSNFPYAKKNNWAGSFTLGGTVDLHHMTTLAPSEICNCSILFITDDNSDGSDSHDIYIDKNDLPNRLAYFPPREVTQGTTPTSIIILHRHSHYTLLTPSNNSDNNAILQILSFLDESVAIARHYPYIPSNYSAQIPNFAHLVGCSSMCTDIDSLSISHELLYKDICDYIGRSQPGSQADNPHNTAAARSEPPLEGSHALPILIEDPNPFLIEDSNPPLLPRSPLSPAFLSLLATRAPALLRQWRTRNAPSPAATRITANTQSTPSPLPGGKHHRGADPGSAEAAHTAPRQNSANTPPTINNLSIHSASPPPQADTPFGIPQDGTPFFGMHCDDIVQSSPDDPSSLSSASAASSHPSVAEPPPWSIERIIRCAYVADEERPCPDSPTNARNIRYLVHRHHLCNIWAPYSTVRTTAACDRFIINNPVITGHTFTQIFPPSSSDTPSNSNSSSIDLGELVTPQARNESIFRFQPGVRGNVSSDTSSLSGSYSASGVGSHVSSSLPPSLDSTGSFHPHFTPTSFATFRPPDCTNRICASMTFGCFHQNNHACDLSPCSRQIEYGEFGWHCPHCDRDYCITCCPVPWDPVSSLTEASLTQDLTQDSLLDYTVFVPPVASHDQAGSKV